MTLDALVKDGVASVPSQNLAMVSVIAPTKLVVVPTTPTASLPLLRHLVLVRLGIGDRGVVLGESLTNHIVV